MTAVGLRERVLRGGAHLALRQAVGSVLAIAGVLLLTRIVGANAYGLFAAAIGLYTTIQLPTQLGIGLFLVRHPDEVDGVTYDVATGLLLLLGAFGALVGMATLPLVQAWTNLDGIGPIAGAVYAGLPIAHLALVPLARLERELDYRRASLCELAAQAAFVVTSLPLALAGLGAWAAVGGWWAQQIVIVVLLHRLSGTVPRVRWDRDRVREMIGYGAGYTGSIWIHQLRRLVNPLVVGRWLGAEAVAIVSVTAQIVTNLSFVGVAAWRLSTAALARIQQDTAKLLRGISEGMMLHLVAVAPFLLLFGVLAPAIVPRILGAEWTPIVALYPFVAFAYLVALTFNMHSASLYVLGRNGAMAVYHVAHTGLLAVVAIALVPRVGILGYGIAELATLAGFAVLHAVTSRYLGSPAYGGVALLGIGVGAALFWQHVGPWGFVVLCVTVLLVRPWRQAGALLASVRGVAREP